jgi:C-terminal peptidase prc
VILKVNGESIAGLTIPDVTKKIKGKVNTPVTLRVRHTTGEEVDLTMNREEIVVPTVKGFKRRPDTEWDWYVSQDPKIGYIRITQFTPDTVDRVKEALSGKGPWKGMLADGMKGLILDLRFNPGGRLDQAVQLVDLFIEKGVIVSTKGRSRPENVVTATAGGTLPYFPMIVLVNEHSASASEIVAGSLMDNQRALVIGERTYGKGSVQELIPLEGNQGELKLTVAYYYLPSGRLVHRKKDATDWGVQPQIAVPMNEEQEKRVMQELDQHEHFLPPVPKRNATQPTTASASQPVSSDVQLQRAVENMIGMVVLQGAKLTGPTTPPRNAPQRPAASVQPGSDEINPTSKPAGTPPAPQPTSTPKAPAPAPVPPPSRPADDVKTPFPTSAPMLKPTPTTRPATTAPAPAPSLNK